MAVLTNVDSAAETVTVTSVARAMDLQLLRSQLVQEASFADWIRESEIDLLLNVHSLHIAHADVVRFPRSAASTSTLGRSRGMRA